MKRAFPASQRREAWALSNTNQPQKPADTSASAQKTAGGRPGFLALPGGGRVSPTNLSLKVAGRHRLPIAIVGGGVAGLTCAQELKRLGLSPVVFDKGKIPGGRIGTRRRDDFEWDLGAAMMTVNHKDFLSQLREWQFRGLARRWRGRFSGPGLEGANDGPFYVGLPRMSALARSLSRDLDLRYPVEVRELVFDSKEQAWQLFDQAGQHLGAFEAVLSTMPGPQTREFFANIDELQGGLKLAGKMMPTWSVYIVFRNRFEVPFDAKTFAGPPIRSLFRNNAKPERDDEPECWVLHADPGLSANFLDYPPAQVVDDMIAALEFSVEQKLPPVVDAHAKRWMFALAEGFGQFRSQFDNRVRLGFGGDWVQPPKSQFGGIEAAYLSGRALAGQTRTLLPQA